MSISSETSKIIELLLEEMSLKEIEHLEEYAMISMLRNVISFLKYIGVSSSEITGVYYKDNNFIISLHDVMYDRLLEDIVYVKSIIRLSEDRDKYCIKIISNTQAYDDLTIYYLDNSDKIIPLVSFSYEDDWDNLVKCIKNEIDYLECI